MRYLALLRLSKMSSIHDRWGVKQPPDEQRLQLKNRLITFLGLIGFEVDESDVVTMCLRFGKTKSQVASFNKYDYTWRLYTEHEIQNAQNSFEIAYIIECLMNVVDKFGSDAVGSQIKKILAMSNSDFNLVKTKKGWLTYPKGEKLLDEKVVEKALTFLTDKPLDEFTHALEHFSQKHYVEAAEKSRRSLEEYLRQTLSRPKLGLDAGIKELGSLMKLKNIENHRNQLIIKQLRLLDGHFNDSSKHNSKTDESEAEFLIYQVASILKFIDLQNLGT